jgi:hypothetical protein
MSFGVKVIWESMIVAMGCARTTTTVCCWVEMAESVSVEQITAVHLKTLLSAVGVDLDLAAVHIGTVFEAWMTCPVPDEFAQVLEHVLAAYDLHHRPRSQNSRTFSLDDASHLSHTGLASDFEACCYEVVYH